MRLGGFRSQTKELWTAATPGQYTQFFPPFSAPKPTWHSHSAAMALARGSEGTARGFLAGVFRTRESSVMLKPWREGLKARAPTVTRNALEYSRPRASNSMWSHCDDLNATDTHDPVCQTSQPSCSACPLKAYLPLVVPLNSHRFIKPVDGILGRRAAHRVRGKAPHAHGFDLPRRRAHQRSPCPAAALCAKRSQCHDDGSGFESLNSRMPTRG